MSAKPSVLVVGDLILDHYIDGACERISPEAPVQVVSAEAERYIPGGAGNVARNLIALGVEVRLCSVVGDDTAARILHELFLQNGIPTEGLICEPERTTTKKSRVTAHMQQLIRIDKETTEPILETTAQQIQTFVEKEIENADLLLLSDYAKGVLTPTLTRKLIAVANAKGKPVFVDPKGNNYEKYRGATLVTPNKKELQIVCGCDLNTEAELHEAANTIRSRYDFSTLLVTLSEAGMTLFGDKTVHIPAHAQEVFDVTGAGDTVIAAFAAAKLHGKSMVEAARYANAAAAVVVSKAGSAVATPEEIARYETDTAETSATPLDKKIVTLPHLLEKLQRTEGKVVFTNGCFDILHAGHVRYLEAANALGEVLIVGLNGDDSVRRLKGDDRPVNRWEDRATLLAALASVDYVVRFDEETPYNLIREIKPDILVKGGDYEGKEIVGSDIAKETRTITLTPGKSTTALINKIRKKG